MQLPFINRWHPLLAIRYLPIVSAIKQLKTTTILEVGSGGLGIGPYLKKPFVGLDIDFSPPLSTHLTPIIGSATHPPFKPNSFQAVICSDTLEHIPPSKRQQVISDLISMATKLVIISVPVGLKAQDQDRQLDQIYFKKHHTHHPFFTDHLQYGLPTQTSIIAAIDQARADKDKITQIEILPNLNLSLRFFLMKGWISINPITNLIHRKILLFFLPILRLFNHPPVYRQLFIVKILN